MKEGQEKPFVLYVDDIQANLLLFQASFSKVFNVLLAQSGKEALEVLKQNEIEVVVTDQNMPGMSGNELLEIVTKEYPDIMRFMITAYTDYETVVEAINRGNLYGFFNKPYNIGDVKHSIYKSLEVRNLRINNREMLEKLESANEAMRTIERSKTRFLTSITDEIRNPINKIMTAVHMIKDKVDSKELTELLNLLDVSIMRLEDFADATNHLIRLTDIDFKLKYEDVSLRELIEVCVIEKNNMIVNKGVILNLDNLSSDRMVSGEFDMLQSCFSFLLGFFIEHIPDNGQLEISLTDKKEEGVVLRMESGEIELSEIEREDLNYFSGQKEFNNEKETKLELMLSNKILTAHEGLLLFSEDENRTVISIEFPVLEAKN